MHENINSLIIGPNSYTTDLKISISCIQVSLIYISLRALASTVLCIHKKCKIHIHFYSLLHLIQVHLLLYSKLYDLCLHSCISCLCMQNKTPNLCRLQHTSSFCSLILTLRIFHSILNVTSLFARRAAQWFSIAAQWCSIAAQWCSG